MLITMSNLSALIDSRPNLTSRQWLIVGIVTIAVMFDFFDFFLLGFIVSTIGKTWNLTVGIITELIILNGIGIIIGGFLWGYISDRVGRKPALIASIIIFSLGSGLMSVTPTGVWQFLGVLRIIVGFGVAGAFTISFPYVAEFVPAKRRGFNTALGAVFVPAGTLLASALSAFAAPVIGWRGIALVSLLPMLLAVPGIFFLKESPRWLVVKGRVKEAKESIAWALKESPDKVDIDESAVKTKKVTYKEVFKYKRSLISSWLVNFGTQSGSYTLTLFATTLLVLLYGITASYAAFLFIFISASAIVARLFFARFMIDKVGRLVSGMICSFGGAFFIILAALFASVKVGNLSMFYFLYYPAYFLIEAAWAPTTAYGSEIWPQAVRSSGWGSSYGFGGLGKTLAPLGMALALGTSLTLSKGGLKHAFTIGKLLPAFAVVAALVSVAGIGYILGTEMKQKSLEDIEASIEAEASTS